jgi:hypothetical protein
VTGEGSFPGDVPAPSARQSLCAGLAAHPAEFDGCLVLAIVRGSGFFDLARGYSHHSNGVADYIGGALLTFGTFGHVLSGKLARILPL